MGVDFLGYFPTETDLPVSPNIFPFAQLPRALPFNTNLILGTESNNIAVPTVLPSSRPVTDLLLPTLSFFQSMDPNIFNGTLQLTFRNDQGGVLQDGPAAEWNNAMTAILQVANALNISIPNGAFLENLGSPDITSSIWYTSPAKTAKVLEQEFTYNAQRQITQQVLTVYNADQTVRVRITDTITYNGVNEATRSRTVV